MCLPNCTALRLESSSADWMQSRAEQSRAEHLEEQGNGGNFFFFSIRFHNHHNKMWTKWKWILPEWTGPYGPTSRSRKDIAAGGGIYNAISNNTELHFLDDPQGAWWHQIHIVSMSFLISIILTSPALSEQLLSSGQGLNVCHIPANVMKCNVMPDPHQWRCSEHQS